MIEYMPREKTRNQEAFKQLLLLSGTADPARQIQRHADSIATAMAKLHGGDWRVQIDHQAGLVLVVRRH